MSIYRLDRLFAQRSIALFGASPRENSVGRNILRNLRNGGYDKPVHVVNPRYPEIEGIPAIKTIEQLPTARKNISVAGKNSYCDCRSGRRHRGAVKWAATARPNSIAKLRVERSAMKGATR